MSRLSKLSCWLLIAEMTAMAVVTLAARWPDIAHHRAALSAFEGRKAFGVGFFPAWGALAIVLMDRRLRPKGMTLSADHRRFVEAGLVAALLMSSGLQAWTAAIFVFRDPDLLHVAPQGVAMLLGGAFFVLYGNAGAKLAPPTGPAAPEPGAWIREHLRSGWTLVLLGIVLMAGAFAPPNGRAIVTLIAVPVTFAIAIAQRRIWRSRSGPRTPA